MTHTPTILLVEDEHLMRHVMRESLELDGYRVLEAANGREALEVLSRWQRPVDVVVTDIMMPVMTGAELIRQVRQRQPGLPVVLVSGWPISNRDTIDAHTLFLRKPVTYGQLAKAVQRSLNSASNP
jgi:two-component system, cell cycle sensor histidine kinase and response regulator CckA